MELNRAFDSTLAILAKVSRDQLDAPTPCASWDVRALINHFTGTARWAAASVAGEAATAEVDYAGHRGSRRSASRLARARGVTRGR